MIIVIDTNFTSNEIIHTIDNSIKENIIDTNKKLEQNFIFINNLELIIDLKEYNDYKLIKEDIVNFPLYTLTILFNSPYRGLLFRDIDHDYG